MSRVLLILLVGLLLASPRPERTKANTTAPVKATPVKVADASCAQCHRAIYNSYLLTPMANASGPAAERFTTGSYNHALSHVDYTLEKVDGRPVLAWTNHNVPGGSGKRDLSYFFGSGHLGTTWLYSVNHYLFESPVAWYSAAGKLDMKPGLSNAKQMLPGLIMQSDCLRCHMSSVQPSDPGTLNRYVGLPFLHGGITCEQCHGDTAAHLASKGKAPVVNTAKLSADKRDSLCISCHLEADITVERAGRSMLNYQPGDSIADYLAFYTYTKSDPLARGVSEVEQFNTSMCKRVSGDRMSCTSCHDPHFSPAPAQRVAFYRSKCLVCHGAPSFVKTHHPDNPDCIGCHMPHNGAENIPHVAWTDHRILPRPNRAPEAQSSSTDVLKAIFSPEANTRDLGMAYYLAYLKGNGAEGAKAWSLLSSQQQEIQSDKDKPAMDALALLNIERGDTKTGESLFQEVLRLDPNDLTANSDLGALMAKQGELSKSLQLLQSAFSRNQDVAGLAMNLARVQCARGDAAGVRSTLTTALVYNPGVRELQQFLQSADTCRAPAQNGTAQ